MKPRYRPPAAKGLKLKAGDREVAGIRTSFERDKPILALDFDGVIHSYHKGWQGGALYGQLTAGFLDWLTEIGPHFKVVVVSSRFSDPGEFTKVWEWLQDQGYEVGKHPFLTFMADKPPAFVTIDDRALRFTGDWADFKPRRLLAFRPWTMRL